MTEAQKADYLVTGTKAKIARVAIELFSRQGFNGVSMREIADAVGIKPGSLYNHFESKDTMLSYIYEVYEYHLNQVLPDMDDLLRQVETEDPRAVLKKSTYYFGSEIQSFMDKTVSLAAYEGRRDKRSDDFAYRILIEIPGDIVRRLLERLLELGRIEPIDIEALVVLFTNFCCSAAIRNSSSHPIGMTEWELGYNQLTKLIVPKTQTAEAEEVGTAGKAVGEGTATEVG
jgi:AcrR family transcriptional regulator